MVKRREVMTWGFGGMMASALPFGLASCQRPSERPSERPLKGLPETAPETLPETLPDFLLGAGRALIVERAGKRLIGRADGVREGLSLDEHMAQKPFTLDTPFRAASMSKTVTLLTALEMAKAGLIDLDADISGPLGMALSHPKFPGEPISLRRVLSHRAGIIDPEAYWVNPPGDIRSILSPALFGGGQPGQFFTYANINYGIAATVMEAVSSERFDRLTTAFVLGPLGIDAGFNWAGVSAEKRASGAALYREVDGIMRVQVDGNVNGEGAWGVGAKAGGARSDPTLGAIDTEDFKLADYVPGTNGTLFSPQGGLRASAQDLLQIAKALQARPELHQADWIYNGQNGNDEGGHFVSFGPGLYVYPPDRSPIPGQLMVGHHGEAYGLYGGLWTLPQIDAQIVHVVTTTPEPPRASQGTPSVAFESQILLSEAAAALGL